LDDAKDAENREVVAHALTLYVVHDLYSILRTIGGYTTPEQQQAMREARALLVEHGLWED
jgi:hypothetical protein